MTKTTEKLIWRLSSLPTPSELQGLVKDGIITKEEARLILLTKESVEERDKKSLESEIKFLRDLVDRLSKDAKVITETIKIIEKPYYNYDWYKPYKYYCTSAPLSSGSVNSVYTSASSINNGIPGTSVIKLTAAGSKPLSFKDIKTF